MEFIHENTLIYKLPHRITKDAIAFDLDWTLVYNDQHLFPKNVDDIHWLPKRVKKLKSLYKKGYTLIIFTNQSVKKDDFKVKRVKYFMENIDIDMGVFIATGRDNYRKPEQGMFERCKQLLPDTTIHYFVGDALGRPQDFSDSDRIFAERAGIKWAEPENVFLFKPPLIKIDKQMIIFIGSPGSGKTTFYHTHLKPLGYVHVNQDLLKTEAKVMKLVKSSIHDGKDICLDRTNGKKSQRYPYEQLAKENGYTVRYFYFVRNGHDWNKLREKPVPDIAYHIFFKNLELPENVEKIC